MADATLSTPITRSSETKYTARSFACSQIAAGIECSVQDAGSNETRVVSFRVPDPTHPTADVNGFLSAIGTARGGESGTVLNRANFRILGFLVDNGYIAGVTLNP